MEDGNIPTESWSFTQHWIIVNKLQVLLLDFLGEFSLLIPNIELGKAFRVNQADVELEIKEIEGGHKVKFIKFTFESPNLEIKAPVLNDRNMGFQVLKRNGACVFPRQILSLSPQGTMTRPPPHVSASTRVPRSPDHINQQQAPTPQAEPVTPAERRRED